MPLFSASGKSDPMCQGCSAQQSAGFSGSGGSHKIEARQSVMKLLRELRDAF
jgi:hypothetical protein